MHMHCFDAYAIFLSSQWSQGNEVMLHFVTLCLFNVFVRVVSYYHSLYMGKVSAGRPLITAGAVYSLDSDIYLHKVCSNIIILGKICLLQ